MQKSKYMSIGLIVLLIVVMIATVGCAKAPIYDINLPTNATAAKTSFSEAIDDSIPVLGMDEALNDNPDRGFRGEIYITLGTDEAYPQSGETAKERLDGQLALYADDDPHIMQTYVYLIEFYNKAIPDSAFQQLKEYFEYIRSKNQRMLLRFAYEYSDSDSRGPKTSRILSHCKQIKEFFKENSQLINDTVYCMQLGLIGLWGEGHGSKYYHDYETIERAVADMTPSNIQIMVRTPELLTQVPQELRHRFGIHDDFLVGIDHKWGMMSFDHPQYQDLLNICQGVLTDGEMPWGRDTTVPVIDHILFLKQCVGYGLTSLSITHNYKEALESEGITYHLEKWKSVYLSKAELEENNFPYNPNMLDAEGKISVYNYLAYHLGYQLSASNLKISDGKVSFMLNNYGMAAPHEFIVDVKIGDRVYSYNAFNASSLGRFGQYTFTLPYTQGASVSIRLKHSRKYELTIKLANDITYTADGFNVLKA